MQRIKFIWNWSGRWNNFFIILLELVEEDTRLINFIWSKVSNFVTFSINFRVICLHLLSFMRWLIRFRCVSLLLVMTFIRKFVSFSVHSRSIRKLFMKNESIFFPILAKIIKCWFDTPLFTRYYNNYCFYIKNKQLNNSHNN